MSNTTQGPTWQTVAAVTGTVLMSIAVGAGGYFVTQQAARDARQDQMLDTFATKLVDISISMVQLKAGQQETNSILTKEATLREERDRREMEDLRSRGKQK
mgnify:FL=1